MMEIFKKITNKKTFIIKIIYHLTNKLISVKKRFSEKITSLLANLASENEKKSSLLVIFKNI